MLLLKKYYGLFVILALGLYVIRPLFISGLFPMHDDTQPSRIFEMANSLRDGIVPVRWSGNLGYGYGYPIFNFYGPFAYYIGGLLNVLGFDVIMATKIVMSLGMILAGVSMYFLSRQFWSETGGIISGLLYNFAPYHALDLYVRGDLAEIYAYAFIPLMFLGIYKVFILLVYKSKIKNQSASLRIKSQTINSKKLWFYISLSSISYAVIILSHNLTALMVTPFLIFAIVILGFYLFQIKKPFAISYLLFAFILGICLSAFYWFPALSEMRYTNVMSQIGGKADFRLHFACPTQLWDSPWGFGGSAPGCTDGMSFRVGKLHLVLALITFLSLPIIWKKSKKISLFVFAVLLLGFVSVWLTIEQSRLVWEYIPVMKFFQYPWRFLLIVSFLISFLGGYLIFFIRTISSGNKYYRYIERIFIISFLLIMFSLYGKLFNPQTIVTKSPANYISQTALKWNISKISDEYMPINFVKPENEKDIVKEKISIIHGSGLVTNEKQSVGRTGADLTIENKSALVLIKTAYFPAWNLYLNNHKSNFTITDRGILVSVPEGKNSLFLRFEQTPFELIGNIITLVGIFTLVLGIIVTYLGLNPGINFKISLRDFMYEKK